MTKMKLGIQLWSIHDVCMKQGFDRAFAAIREQGYEGVEFALASDASIPEHYNTTMEEIKKALSNNGIKAVGVHTAFEQVLKNPDAILEECLELELPYIAVFPELYPDRTPFDRQKKAIEQTGKLAWLFKGAGIQPQVHCSAFTYMKDYKGRHMNEGYIEELGIERLQPEFDTAWMIVGGAEPIGWFKKYAGHIDIVHLKDFHPPMENSDYILVRHNTITEQNRGCAVGDQGVQDVESIVKTVGECGGNWILTELWNEPNSMENAKISAQNIMPHL